ncbi:MAG: hypothetical protein JWR50_1743 [Mucilaginibacter sp.]|nr:hypothetical protein [Mucilaginibacter sp.]
MRTILLSFFLLVTISTQAQIFKTYRDGYYYTTSGEKISGLIFRDVYEDYFKFKTDKEASAVTIKISGIKSLVAMEFVGPGQLQPDTLLALSENGDLKKTYFGKLLFATPTAKLYYKFKPAPGGGGSMTPGTSVTPNMGSTGSQPAFTSNLVFRQSGSRSSTHNSNIVMYEKEGTTFEVDKKNFKAILSNAFAEDADLSSRILNEEYKFKQVWEIVGYYQDYLDSKSGKQ